MINYLRGRVDYTDLQMVKRVATYIANEFGTHQTVILRPGQTSYNIIHTANEPALLRDAMVVYRTGEHKHE